MATKEQIITALKEVKDPEIGLDIYSLGLVYNIEILNEKQVDIRMTFTSPQCPYGPYILEDVKSGLNKLGIEEVNIDLVFSPPWKPSDELKAALGIGGVD